LGPETRFARGQTVEFKENINLKLRKAVMREPQVGFVDSEGFVINLVLMRSPMAVWAERNQVAVLVPTALLPWDNVMHVHVDMTTCGYRTPMSRFDENTSLQVCWN